MSAAGWVSLVALIGWLALTLSAFRVHHMGGRKMLAMGLTWTAIFLLVTAIAAGLAARSGGAP